MTTINIESLTEGHAVSDKRRESLVLAIELGADAETLAQIRDARRLSRTDAIVLPAGRLQHLSRGRGWCRSGRRDSAKWADRTDNDDYRVDEPGVWIVGCSDGFSRKDETKWRVSHVTVGEQTWTIAN